MWGGDGGDVVLDPGPPVAGENQPLRAPTRALKHTAAPADGDVRRLRRAGGTRRRFVASVIESWSSTARAFLNRDRSRSLARVLGHPVGPCQGIDRSDNYPKKRATAPSSTLTALA